MGRIYGTKKVDLGTSEGLLRTAETAGLGQRAGRVFAEKGERPEEIFSGGIISDIFDGLNFLQHGVTGVLQGKGFAEGVKTRASFSKKDQLGQYEIPGTVAGIALDIAVDPLTYIPPLAIAKRIPFAGKTGKALLETAKQTGIGKKLGQMFVYRFGQDPVYKQLAVRTEKNISQGVQNVLDLARPIAQLSPEAQKSIAAARKSGRLGELSSELREKARPAFDELDRLGKEAVNAGLLKKEVYDENVGKYIARLYRKHEAPQGIIKSIAGFGRKPIRIDLSRFKQRKDIPEDVREAMGEILEAGYPTAKALVQLTNAIERAKFFKEVAGKFGKDVIESGFKKLPDAKTLGVLAGKHVPESIFDDIQEIIRIKTPLERNLNKVVTGFKFGKVILNPATHARNIISNFLLNDFEGLSPARLDIYAKAAKSLATKDSWYKEATEQGLGFSTFASQELRSILRGPEVGFLGKAKSMVFGFADKASSMYQKEEEFAKMAQYIFQRSKNVSPEEAWRIAERATFNYAQVTPFIRRVRESLFGFPFITFTYKVTPRIFETALTKPGKISKIGKIKNAIENQANLGELRAERESEPNWIRDGFFVKLPMKDKYGRSAYFDLTYIIPFGDLISGGLISQDIVRETGLKEGLPAALLEKTPLLNLITEIGRNQDFFGNQVWKKSDPIEKQTGDLMRHLAKTYLPPLVADQLPGGYRPTGEQRGGSFERVLKQERGIETGGTQTRTLVQEMLRHVGLKVQPVDLELQKRFMELEKKRALETLLEESGEAKTFKRTFIPKTEKKGRIY